MTDTHNIRLMAHLVAGYPDDETAFSAARALVEGGASMLEIQLPFSDPSADGPAIQEACAEVLARNYRTKDTLTFISRIHRESPELPLFLMSYASLVYTPGIRQFCKAAAEAGIKGLIIPDLPFDHDEGLTDACRAYGMENIPVAAPSMTHERLSILAKSGFTYIYAALRAGITGSSTRIEDKTMRFLTAVSEGGAHILGGFGITTGEQARELSDHVYAVVAGSVFVRLISGQQKNSESLFLGVRAKAEELSTGGTAAC